MQFITYILIYPLIWLISLLPLRVLYLFSDFAFFIIFRLFKYRKKVVRHNINLTFPKKTEQEKELIVKKFFHHFMDVFIEMIKSFTISKKELKKRYQFTNIELFDQLEKENKNIIIVGSHYANWEWIFIMNSYVNYNGIAAFSKIQNKYIDKAIRASRGRFNTTLVTTSKMIELLEKNLKNNILSIYGLLSDQRPQPSKTRYWREFLGVNTPIHTGAEFLAKKHNFAVVMLKTKKIKRGHYLSTFDLITDTPREHKDYEITDIFFHKLEEQIREEPQYYFWSHKRFKFREPTKSHLV
jgi:KDO2-lipid IV(A) lauroyltransferase